ncbi:MAG: hypothetical protein AAFZ49_00025 [Cyanobacteria bacterium J06659_2]
MSQGRARQQEINGLSEAQRRLLEKFPLLEPDDPLVELAAWNAALEKRLDLFGGSVDGWTTAILKQAEAASQQGQLFVAQNSTLQETARNNAVLASILQALKPKIEQLLKDSRLQALSISTQDAALSSLRREIEGMRGEVQGIGRMEDRLIRKIEISSDEPWRRWVLLCLAVFSGGVLALSGMAVMQMRLGNYQGRLMNSALIRLERIERGLEIQP